jgi:hypothetical protein
MAGLDCRKVLKDEIKKAEGLSVTAARLGDRFRAREKAIHLKSVLALIDGEAK